MRRVMSRLMSRLMSRFKPSSYKGPLKPKKGYKVVGGYVHWIGPERFNRRLGRKCGRYTKEVYAYVPASVQTDDCGKGTNTVVQAILSKAERLFGEKKGSNAYWCDESWDV